MSRDNRSSGDEAGSEETGVQAVAKLSREADD
jgi:hypothetical protein